MIRQELFIGLQQKISRSWLVEELFSRHQSLEYATFEYSQIYRTTLMI
jgi:hypothetical protein